MAPAGGLDVESLGDLPPGTTLAVVSWAPASRAQGAGENVIAVPPRRGVLAALRRRILSVPSGAVRALVRLTPLDEGVWFWSAASRVAAADCAAAHADVIVALDRDAIYSAFRWQRGKRAMGRRVVSVLGYPAARIEIAKASAE